MSNGIVKTQDSVVVTNDGVYGLMQAAIQKLDGDGAVAAVGVLERLVALQERDDAKKAERAFIEALMQFQSECPSIKKNKTASIVTKSGGQYSYKYADLDHIVTVVRPILKDHGFSFSWDSATTDGKITCTCKLRHVEGHSDSATFEAPTDTKAAMSGAQQSAAALTFARRQSLVALLGLTSCDPDSDGAPPPQNDKKVTLDQVLEIETLMTEVKVDTEKFLKFMGVDALDDVPAHDFRKAMNALEQKKRQANDNPQG